MRHFAKNLRINQTDVERFLWHQLRNRRLCGYKFRRQQIIEPYIVDFVCYAHRLIIELDGSQHMEHVAYDSTRTAFLESQGFRVQRIWNNEVLSNMEGVLDFVLTALRASPSPQPSPARGEGASCALRASPSPQPSPARGEGASCALRAPPSQASPAEGEGASCALRA
jgi:very-short-patch-repair endonuclease